MRSCGQAVEKGFRPAKEENNFKYNFKYNQTGSRRINIYFQFFAFSVIHWLNMVSLVLDIFPVSGVVWWLWP